MVSMRRRGGKGKKFYLSLLHRQHFTAIIVFLFIFFPGLMKFIASEVVTLRKRWISDLTTFGSSS